VLVVLGEGAFGSASPDGFLDGLLQFFVGSDGDSSSQIVAQERVERLGQVAAHGVVVVNLQSLEEG
jgi:hypothetical protein